MKVVFAYVLFNVITGHLDHTVHIVPPTFDDLQTCFLAVNHTGPQKPDKDGNVKLYGCMTPGKDEVPQTPDNSNDNII